jgi:hypothetical protein
MMKITLAAITAVVAQAGVPFDFLISLGGQQSTEEEGRRTRKKQQRGVCVLLLLQS